MSVIQNDKSKPQDRSEIWKRGLMMLFLLICFGFGYSLLALIAIAQFIGFALNQRHNQLLAQFGRSLARWLSETALFLCCAAENKPFPWGAWPSS
jgi:hypothetical protein